MSLPNVAKQSPAATAAAEPPELPPATFVLSSGFFTVPYIVFSLAEPIANSSQLSLPIIIASSANNLSITVALNKDSKPSKILEEAETL